ncbi:MAG TPA: lysophospholipid acyltransferase family protein [Planctomycetota bacterium]|jgi:1-acyl-sn-glycerol-3-phosphate acyltransferase
MTQTTTVPELIDRPPERGGLARGLLVGLFVAPWTGFWGVVCMVLGLLRCSRAAQASLDLWASGIVKASGVKLRVTWRGQHQPDRPCVLLANHQSALDIPILMTACRPTLAVRFMAKESLFKIPLMGWGMRATGFIPIRRESARHAAETFQEILQSTSKLPYSFIIFPEGTRSDDGRLQPFKRGTFGLALRLGLPIVPVTLIDACRANPKCSYRVRKGTVQVVFHEPIELSADESDRSHRDELVERVHAVVAGALPGDQRPEQPGRNRDAGS